MEKYIWGENGELFKAFNVKDGCGIKDILPRYNIIPVIITARESKILEHRCQELGRTELHQGIREKIDKLTSIIDAYNEKQKEIRICKDFGLTFEETVNRIREMFQLPENEAQRVMKLFW